MSFGEPHAVPAAGYLVSTDAYMNLQLANTEEFIDGTFTGNLGEVLIRCVCRDMLRCSCALQSHLVLPPA